MEELFTLIGVLSCVLLAVSVVVGIVNTCVTVFQIRNQCQAIQHQLEEEDE